MYVSPRVKRWLWAAIPVVAFLLPGWGGTLRPTPHDTVLERLRSSPDVFGVTRQVEGDAGEWHATYMESWAADLLTTLNLRGLCTYVVPPDYAAYIPPGARLADEYFAVETRLRWPWWWPGGGVDWTYPD